MSASISGAMIMAPPLSENSVFCGQHLRERGPIERALHDGTTPRNVCRVSDENRPTYAHQCGDIISILKSRARCRLISPRATWRSAVSIMTLIYSANSWHQACLVGHVGRDQCHVRNDPARLVCLWMRWRRMTGLWRRCSFATSRSV